MVVDTSALVAVLLGEPDCRALVEAIEEGDTVRMSVASLVEVSMVIESRRGAAGLRELDALVSRTGIELVPVDQEQAYLAREAFSRFGKGRHRAKLNYGDCFSYALARVLGEPLLAKGDDFVHTDVMIAGSGLR